MNHPISFQLNMAREWCLDVAQSCPPELADVQLEVFPNTIRWQLGHILTVAERMLFQFPFPSGGAIPPSFIKWFDSGSTPRAWADQSPSTAEIIERLKRQQERFLAITAEQFEVRLAPPFYGYSSYGECAGFVIVHESFHVGKIDEMLRVIKHRS
jgi:hypothetical protein